MQHIHHTKLATHPAPRVNKPVLNMVQLPIFRVHYRTLEAYLCRVLHFPDYDFLLATGTVPGLVPEFNVGPTISDNRIRRANAARQGQRTHDVDLLLALLCHDGYIPAGKYIIDTRPEKPAIEVYKALLQATGTPEAEECRDFRLTHCHDRHFVQLAATIDTQILELLRSKASR